MPRTHNKLVLDFVSMISHELRTPLSSIKEGLSLVLDGIDGPLTPAQHQTLTIVKDNVDRLARLINSALDFSRLQSGKVPFAFGKTDLKKLLTHIHDFMKLAADKKSLRLKLDLPKKPVIVQCDEDKLKQILINVVDNAIKFTHDGGRIRLHLGETSSHQPLIEVEDTGMGIPKKEQSKIFRTFAQVYRKGMCKIPGSGLGLAISKQIIEKHKGKIAVASRPNKGSKFSIILPAQR